MLTKLWFFCILELFWAYGHWRLLEYEKDKLSAGLILITQSWSQCNLQHIDSWATLYCSIYLPLLSVEGINCGEQTSSTHNWPVFLYFQAQGQLLLPIVKVWWRLVDSQVKFSDKSLTLVDSKLVFNQHRSEIIRSFNVFHCFNHSGNISSWLGCNLFPFQVFCLLIRVAPAAKPSLPLILTFSRTLCKINLFVKRRYLLSPPKWLNQSKSSRSSILQREDLLTIY